MNILLLAPHPFYQERGTPIDVRLVLRALSQRGARVDVVTYAEGEDIVFPGVQLRRVKKNRLTRGIRPGFSAKKLIADFQLLKLAGKLCRANRYDVIHAGEEAVFISMYLQWKYRIPYVYDLDSSIAQQLVEQMPRLGVVARLFNALETQAIRGALANLPVCNALANLCEQQGSRRTFTLHDISQLRNPEADSHVLRDRFGLRGLLILYVGNLEPYQGIDLLLEAFRVTCGLTHEGQLVIAGGIPAQIERYRAKAEALSIASRTHFIGPQPFEQLDSILSDADILACPRIRGVNTPMKVFSYLHTGKPVVATDLITHNQILTANEALLAPADPNGFGRALATLIGDASLRQHLGRQGRAFVEREHTWPAYKRRFDEAYGWVEAQLTERARRSGDRIAKARGLGPSLRRV